MPKVDLRNLRILVVDDSRTARKYLSRCLSDLGAAEVVAAEDGADAIDTLRNFAADIVISDLNMAPLDGIQFTRLVRNSEDSPAPYVPIILLTAEATRKQLENALEAGVHSFLAKPVSAEKLRKHILHTMNTEYEFLKEGKDLRPVPCSPSPQVVAG